MVNITPLYPQGKNLGTPEKRGSVGPRTGLEILGKKKISSCRDSKPRQFSPQSSRYTDNHDRLTSTPFLNDFRLTSHWTTQDLCSWNWLI
jgi:hypothetical protein